MKSYSFNLSAQFVDNVFSPLRTKAQVLIVLMKCVKLMLSGGVIPECKRTGQLTLSVSKRSRLFLFSENKYFSIVFPFFVEEVNGALSFSTKNIKSVDSKITSEVVGVLSVAERFDCGTSLDFVESIIEIEEDEPEFWPFLLGLFMYEDGYVRYDYDPEHEDGDLHPLNHYDFFYSSSATCKVGLRNKLNDIEEMIDFLLPETACHYIESRRGERRTG